MIRCYSLYNAIKKNTSCKFCGSTEKGERISSCKKRAKLKGSSVEYILGMSQDGMINLIKKNVNNISYEPQTTIPNSYNTNNEKKFPPLQLI